MKCPVCGEYAYASETRSPKGIIGTTNRTRECGSCLTRFKTVEKVVFTSLPPYVREKFLSEGKRK